MLSNRDPASQALSQGKRCCQILAPEQEERQNAQGQRVDLIRLDVSLSNIFSSIDQCLRSERLLLLQDKLTFSLSLPLLSTSFSRFTTSRLLSESASVKIQHYKIFLLYSEPFQCSLRFLIECDGCAYDLKLPSILIFVHDSRKRMNL